MDYIVYADNSPVTILGEKEVLSLFRHPMFTENTFWNLLEQKVILRKDFEALKKNIDEVMSSSELMRFHWIADSVKMCLESAKDCIFLRQKTVDLFDFLETAIARWKPKDNTHNWDTFLDLIIEAFPDIEEYGFGISDVENSLTLANCIYEEVVDYWGGICWEQSDLALNDMNPIERSEMNLEGLLTMMSENRYY